MSDIDVASRGWCRDAAKIDNSFSLSRSTRLADFLAVARAAGPLMVRLLCREQNATERLVAMEDFEVNGKLYTIGRAEAGDVRAIADLLADDVLGAARESDNPTTYEDAFREIVADPNQFLAVIRDDGGVIVGTMQLTTVPGLARAGAKRLLIEGVRLGSSVRGSGLGSTMFAWAHEYGRREGAVLAQLTSDKSRTDAHRFYERLGYTATHEGFKLPL